MAVREEAGATALLLLDGLVRLPGRNRTMARTELQDQGTTREEMHPQARILDRADSGSSYRGN